MCRRWSAPSLTVWVRKVGSSSKPGPPCAAAYRLIDAFEVHRDKLPEVRTGVRQLVQVDVLGEAPALCDDQPVRVALDCRR